MLPNGRLLLCESFDEHLVEGGSGEQLADLITRPSQRGFDQWRRVVRLTIEVHQVLQ